MKTNLIQNYINTKPITPVQPVQVETDKKPLPNFSIQEELNNRTFIKPLKSNAKFARDGFFDAPASLVKNTIYDVKSLKHGIEGTANDHELGKLNDIGLKVGGLAIATYLFTKKTTPKTKAMEFVGLGTFLASMALWPKIAIQLPAKLIHGVNVHKQYEDNFGRKKPVYQDPQFVPWDLYSDKQIDKIGDRLGVPRNVNNRRDLIQEKMKKIAVQSNTLWMLTAGFATPIMSGLLCNLLEGPLADYQNKLKNKKAASLLKNFNETTQKYINDDRLKEVSSIVDQNLGAELDDKLIKKITGALTSGIDPLSAKTFEDNIKRLFITNEFALKNTSAKELSDNIKGYLIKDSLWGNLGEEVIEQIVPSEFEFADFLKKENILDKAYNLDDTNTIKQILIQPIIKKVEAYNMAHDAKDAIDIEEFYVDMISPKNGKNAFTKTFNSYKSNVLNSENQKVFTELAEIMDGFRAKLSVLEEYAYTKVAAAPETSVAHAWHKAQMSLFDALGISSKDLKIARFDRELTNKILTEKLEKISSDKELYKSTMTKIVAAISKLDSDINVDPLYNEKVNSVFDDVAKALKSKGLDSAAEALNGVVKDGANEVQLSACVKEVYKKFVSNRLLGVQSSFYRVINTMDLYRRISTQEGNGIITDPKLAREIKEELVELTEHIMTQGHASDFAVKFYHLRNPKPNMEDCSNIEINKSGKMVRKYGIPMGERVDIPQDCTFFQKAMKMMFGDSMHSDTVSILNAKNLKEALDNYRNRMIEEVGGDKYFAKPFSMTERSKAASSKTKFLLTGIATDELLYKGAKEAYNTKTWLKMFGGFGAVLLGVTIGAQFLFGKTKLPDERVLQTGNKG